MTYVKDELDKFCFNILKNFECDGNFLRSELRSFQNFIQLNLNEFLYKLILILGKYKSLEFLVCCGKIDDLIIK